MRANPTDSLLDYLSEEAGNPGWRIGIEAQLPPGRLSGRTPGAVIYPSAPCYCQLYRRNGAGHCALKFSTEAPIPVATYDFWAI